MCAMGQIMPLALSVSQVGFSTRTHVTSVAPLVYHHPMERRDVTRLQKVVTMDVNQTTTAASVNGSATLPTASPVPTTNPLTI
ncbi:hypothetical protein DPMN_038621 [Dreissena polymorpha]|uniref:Uncharacterized protein n=1 Tax=Dreissena polymorpha TaxID=45954 RepID=A0A9D4MEJ8_DREPO|nr:hypothetical protein DPMN_038621 [Dreissena polymorpha]